VRTLPASVGRSLAFVSSRRSEALGGPPPPGLTQEQEHNQVEREPERDCRSDVVQHRGEDGTLNGCSPSCVDPRRLRDEGDHGVERPREDDVEPQYSSQKDEHEPPIARRRSMVGVSPQRSPSVASPKVEGTAAFGQVDRRRPNLYGFLSRGSLSNVRGLANDTHERSATDRLAPAAVHASGGVGERILRRSTSKPDAVRGAVDRLDADPGLAADKAEGPAVLAELRPRDAPGRRG
jgi:hypothetical protein